MKRLAAAMLCALVTLLAACSSTISGQAAAASKVSTSSSTKSSSSTSSTSKTTTSKTTTSTSTTPTVTLPPGYDWWDESLGIAFRGLNPDVDSFECIGSQNFCFAVSVYSVYGCPAGAKAEMTIYASALSDEVIGTASNYTAAIDPGGTQLAIIGFNTDNADAAAAVSNITC